MSSVDELCLGIGPWRVSRCELKRGSMLLRAERGHGESKAI